jgi:hypothetical protein
VYDELEDAAFQLGSIVGGVEQVFNVAVVNKRTSPQHVRVEGVHAFQTAFLHSEN